MCFSTTIFSGLSCFSFKNLQQTVSSPLVTTLIILLFFGLFSSGCVHRGEVSIGQPVIHGDKDAKESLKRQIKEIEIAAKKVEAVAVQQSLARSQSIGFQVRGSYENLPSSEGEDAGPDTESPDLPTHENPALEASLPVINPDTSLMFNETLKALATKRNHLEGIKLLYEGDVSVKGQKNKLFLVRFDLWVSPERQRFWMYPFHWLDTMDIHARDYTEDYQVEFNFVIPPSEKNGPSIKVYAVQPVNESVVALEAMNTAEALGLSAAMSGANYSAQVDYQNNFRQLLNEQRKHPLIRGIVDSPNEFRFIISPRRRIEEKSWSLPWTSRFQLTQRLEPEVHPVYIYLLVSNAKTGTDPIVESPDAETTGILESHLVKGDTGIISRGINSLKEKVNYWFDDENTIEKEKLKITSEGNIVNVPLVAYAHYKKSGEPYTRDPVPFKNKAYPSAYEREIKELVDDGQIDARIVKVSLPVTDLKDILESSVPKVKVSGGEVRVNWANQNFKGYSYTLFSNKSGKFQLCWDGTRIALSSFDKSTGENVFWINHDNDKTKFRIQITSINGSKTWTPSFSFKKPPAPMVLKPKIGSPGQLVHVEFDLEGADISFEENKKAVCFGDICVNPKQTISRKSPRFNFDVLIPKDVESKVVSLYVEVDNPKDPNFKIVTISEAFTIENLPEKKK